MSGHCARLQTAGTSCLPVGVPAVETRPALCVCPRAANRLMLSGATAARAKALDMNRNPPG